MRKSVTPVVGVALIVFMTIAAVSFAFLWVSNVHAGIIEQVGVGAETAAGRSCSQFSIISLRGDQITISNVGCDDITNVSLIIDGVLSEQRLEEPLNPGSATSIPFTNLEEGEDHCVTVFLPNGVRSVECIEGCSLEQGCSTFVFTIEGVDVT